MPQPATALRLIVDKTNVNKGLASRFLWLFPKPSFKDFKSIELYAGAHYPGTNPVLYLFIFRTVISVAAL